MRIKNSFKNILISAFMNLINVLIGFIAQSIFIKTLGSEYLGLNSLLNNIISMLAITELGLGTAIIYTMYEPLASSNKEKIKSLIELYKKSYHVIGLIIFVLGILFLPFLGLIVGKVSISENVNYIYLLFLLDSVLSYFLSYKKALLTADQKDYIANLVHIAYIIILNAIQIFILIKFKNYYLYLLLRLIFRLLENIIDSLIVDYRYPYIKEKNITKLSKETLNDIVVKIKSLFLHKVGSFLVLGTDSILISILFGLSTLGIYSNYYLIIAAVTTLFGQFFDSTKSSVGNLIVTSSKEKVFDVYKKIKFGNAWVSIFTATAIFVIMDSFITIWVGKQYILSSSILFVLTINYYLQSMRSANTIFKEAAGIFYEDRFIPIIESLVNIIFSILFAKLFGLIGIFIGTLLSNLVLHLYSYPKYVYRKIFNLNYFAYLKENFLYLCLFIFILVITYLIGISLPIKGGYYIFAFKLLIGLVIPNIILLILFNQNSEFKYYVKYMKRLISKNF